MKTGALSKKRSRALSWPPMPRFEDFQSELEKLWNRPFGWLTRQEGFTPTLDVYEKKGKLVVKAELPGVKKEDVVVELSEGNLVIRGEKHHEEKTEEEDYYHYESRFGSFYRSLPLSFDADPDKIKASFKNGVLHLEVEMPTKKEEPREIDIL